MSSTWTFRAVLKSFIQQNSHELLVCMNSEKNDVYEIDRWSKCIPLKVDCISVACIVLMNTVWISFNSLWNVVCWPFHINSMWMSPRSVVLILRRYLTSLATVLSLCWESPYMISGPFYWNFPRACRINYLLYWLLMHLTFMMRLKMYSHKSYTWQIKQRVLI